MKAEHFGVVFRQGKPVRVINPTYEVELDWHHLDENEQMIRYRKDAFGIGDIMMPSDLWRVLDDTSLSGIADGK